MESLWRKQTGPVKTKDTPGFEAASSSAWDVIVVGAGMAGILIAYYLQEAGKRVLVLEAKTVASGQTERTTAKISSQHDLKYSQLIHRLGEKKARLYALANQYAIEEYEQLIQSKGIECQFQRVPAYLYTTQNEEAIKREALAAASLGIEAFYTRETELPFDVKGAVCFPDQAQFAPLLFLQHLVSELEILEHTKVTAVHGRNVITEKGVLQADQIVIATHYPFLNVPGFYFMRQHQERSYMLALSGCPQMIGMYYGVDASGLSFRQTNKALLICGGAKRTGENQSGGDYEMLRIKAKQLFPNAHEIAHWSAQDCMPHDGIPFIGQYSIFTPRLYVATGFQKWGMSSSMVAAMILRDKLTGRKNPYEAVFKPQRLNFHAAMMNWWLDMRMSTKGLWKGFFHRPKQNVIHLKRGQGEIVTISGRRYACYRDDNGILHQISARCAHLGCELTWNPDEKSWDCPCHGSRFDMDGHLLDNPAKRRVKAPKP